MAKIGGWVFLNLLLLAALFFLVFQTQFRFGLDALLAGPAGERVFALTHAVLGTLRASPPSDWGEVLQTFGEAYKVEFTLVAGDGRHIAGNPAPLPEEVHIRVAERRGPGDMAGRGPSFGKGPRRGRLQPEAPKSTITPPRFAMRTENPRRYWVALHVPPLQPPGDGLTDPIPGPWTLLMTTDSLHKGGLFLDLRVWVFTAAAAIVLSAVLWIPLVRGLTRSVSELTRATNEIAGGNFSIRVPENRGDELGQLGASVNRMADRLNGFVRGQKRFLGDTAHELCSPLARMQMALGILDQTASSSQAGSVHDLREDVDEMSALVNELLSFSKASLGGGGGQIKEIRLRDLVREAADREAGSGTNVEIAVPDGMTVMGRPDLLRRAVSNLIRNALRYAGTSDPILISAEASDDFVSLHVRDHGPGVPDGDLERIFDPFFRSEQSRSRETGGAGLGLAIVKTCVEACGGSVQAVSRKPGLEVTLRLQKSGGD
jgi:two-component system sensor histidine kinase CpxA